MTIGTWVLWSAQVPHEVEWEDARVKYLSDFVLPLNCQFFREGGFASTLMLII